MLRRVIIGLAVWNGATTLCVVAIAFLCGKPVLRALLLMASGVSLLWIFLAGSLMLAFRRPIRAWVRTLRVDWRVTFVLFCTVLALMEEVVTTTMTNCAPLFGVPMFGFWIFVYGLMIYLPAYSLPQRRSAHPPGPLQFLLAPVFPILCAVPVAIVLSTLHPVKMHFPPMVIDPPSAGAPHVVAPGASHGNIGG